MNGFISAILPDLQLIGAAVFLVGGLIIMISAGAYFTARTKSLMDFKKEKDRRSGFYYGHRS